MLWLQSFGSLPGWLWTSFPLAPWMLSGGWSRCDLYYDAYERESKKHAVIRTYAISSQWSRCHGRIWTFRANTEGNQSWYWALEACARSRWDFGSNFLPSYSTTLSRAKMVCFLSTSELFSVAQNPLAWPRFAVLSRFELVKTFGCLFEDDNVVGIGFAKTGSGQCELLRDLGIFVKSLPGCLQKQPVLTGSSRKGFLGKITGEHWHLGCFPSQKHHGKLIAIIELLQATALWNVWIRSFGVIGWCSRYENLGPWRLVQIQAFKTPRNAI